MTAMDDWRPIPEFPGYEVSSSGGVRSVDRVSHGRRYQGREMKTAPGSSGYPKVQLGKGNHQQVHQLVLLTFRGPCPEGMEACHGDGNRGNNALSNLRWGTRSSNALDRETHGTGISGESNPRVKLTDVDVVSIRRLRTKGWKLREIADRFNVTPANISYICRGETRNG